ncbi:MAG: hypothetical protein FJX54_19405 [Alphaproteobacteria bacterium]|nr:hypothetical protein [Alphaproteobacteria bacterium]
MRSSHYTARSLLRAKVEKFAHKVEMLNGTDAEGNDDYKAWERRHAEMLRWAHERCGPNGYTTSSRSVEMKGGFRDVVSFHFATGKDSNAFQTRFIDKWRG